MPPILSTSHCEFNGTYLCAHARKNISLIPIHPITKQMVPSLCPELLTQSLSKSISPKYFSYVPYKVLPSINNIYTCIVFSCFYFHHTLSHGLAETYVNHEKYATINYCMSFKEIKVFLYKATSWLQLISKLLVAPACLHAVSDWPRTFFTQKVFIV